jgi:hypothetical protein
MKYQMVFECLPINDDWLEYVNKYEFTENPCDIEHDWLHIPLSDYKDCRRCGEIYSKDSE